MQKTAKHASLKAVLKYDFVFKNLHTSPPSYTWTTKCHGPLHCLCFSYDHYSNILQVSPYLFSHSIAQLSQFYRLKLRSWEVKSLAPVNFWWPFNWKLHFFFLLLNHYLPQCTMNKSQDDTIQTISYTL